MSAFFTNANIENDLNSFLDKSYPDLVLRNHPTLGLATHKEESGKSVVLPASAGYTQSEATEMSDSVGLGGETLREQWVFLPNKKYHTEDVNMAQAAYSEDPDTAAVDVMTDGMKKALIAASEAAEKALWGDGYGTLATIKSSTNPSGNIFVLTLNNPQDAWKIGRNAVLSSKATPSSGTKDAGTCKVNASDPLSGTLTVDGGGTWTPSNTHVLGLSKVQAASTSPVTFLGIPAFNPDVDARAAGILTTPLMGVTRSADPIALAGVALDCRGQSVKQALNALLQTMSNIGGIRVEHAFLNYSDFQKLLDDLGSNRVMLSVEGEMGMNYEGVEFLGPNGKVTVISGTFVPAGRVQVCDISTLIIGPPKGHQFIENKARSNFIEVPDDDVARIAIRTNGFVYISNTAAWGNALI